MSSPPRASDEPDRSPSRTEPLLIEAAPTPPRFVLRGSRLAESLCGDFEVPLRFADALGRGVARSGRQQPLPLEPVERVIDFFTVQAYPRGAQLHTVSVRERETS
jgi:hypothetical protein